MTELRSFSHWVIERRTGGWGFWVTFPEEFPSAQYARSYANGLDPKYEFRIVRVTLTKEVEHEC